MELQVKRRLTFLFITFLLSTFIILLLYLYSIRQSDQKNGFSRVINEKGVMRKSIADLKYDSYYIAGITPNTIYLGNYTAPAQILTTDYNFAKTRQVSLNLHDSLKYLLEGAALTIDSPNFYISNSFKGRIIYGHLSTGRMMLVKSKARYYSLVPISSSSSILKGYDERHQQTNLLKQKWDSLYFNSTTPLLQRQVDGHFSLDGMLHYSHSSAKLVYVYYYRNEITCIDTNLVLLYKAQTIDTFAHADIKIGTVKSQNQKTLLGTPKVVNRLSCVSGDKIFVNSNVKSDNDDKDRFKDESVIDVYDLNDGHYVLSFYLPKYGGKKVSSFRVLQNKLLAFYGNFLVAYDLTF